MSNPRRVMSTEYIEWAKLHAGARYNLATSGVMNFPLAELGVSIEQLEINGPGGYGYAPLQQALAKKCGVSPDCVVAAIGTSMANYLAMAAVVEPGDDVLIEYPAYEPLVAVAHYLGANVRRFRRRFRNGFRIEFHEIELLVTPRTRLIVLTNLHNPSGALADDATLREFGEIARHVGAHVLVDEVYLEMLAVQPVPVVPRSAFLLGEEFIVTSSLTKAYGLSGLRCGWILAAPPLAHKMWRLDDLFGNIAAHPAELLSVIALEKLPQIAARARTLLQTNRVLLDRFLDSRSDLEAVRPPCGTIVFPRLKFARSGEASAARAEEFFALFREKYETSVVPGKFFDMPEHFRIGIGGDTATLDAALTRLSSALDSLANSPLSF
jgi:aspartate/methionine/tyrosine aminotransferase